MKLKSFLPLVLSLVLTSPMLVSGAGLFSDVSDSHLFKGEIESLARSGILKGNPDGKFYPDRSVNRAEFLKMLYVATGRTPAAVSAKCFSDVEEKSWYETYVCDAASKDNSFVKGYSDGKFRPASPVSRTEALKMVFMLFKIAAPDISQDDKNLIKFVDISTSAWYSKFVSAAFQNGILPLAGQSGARFYPDLDLLRGEAAATIFNAQNTLLNQQTNASQSSSVSSAVGTGVSILSSSASSSSSSVRADIAKSLAIPFLDSDQFVEKKPAVYLFTMTKYSDVSLQVATAGYYHSEVTCRLYLLKDDGFSSEYYLGFQESSLCTIKATLRPGKYQFQVQPTVANVLYTASAKIATGDGNDGFSAAVELKSGMPKVGVLDQNDLFDWYSFPITKERMATIEMTSGEKLNCIIYTPLDVDQFGFKGPECNVPYLFGASDSGESYIIGIGRQTGDSIHKIPYTVLFR